MLHCLKTIFRCSNTKEPINPSKAQAVLSYYTSGKTTIAISQQLVSASKAVERLYPNYYIREEMCGELEKISPGFCSKSIDMAIDGENFTNIFRILVRAHIGNKDISLNINSLKSNPYLKKLIQLRETEKFISKTSQVVIDDEIIEKKDEDIEHALKSNMLEVEKLIEHGLRLPVSYMISKSNINSHTWMKLLSKKRKSIHSDVIECEESNKNSEKKGHSLEETVYNHGFRLENIFLRPYCHGCPTDLLENNDSFNLEELLKVLMVIDFKGKIVLENTEGFYKNIEFLDAAFKKVGFLKKKTGNVDLIQEYMIF